LTDTASSRETPSDAGPQPADPKLRELVRELTRREFTSGSHAVRKHLEVLFSTPGLCQDKLAAVSLSALSHDIELARLLAVSARPSGEGLKQSLLDPEVVSALDDPLLHAVLRRSIVREETWEPLLRGLRQGYIHLAADNSARVSSPAHLRVLVSLACQIFNNEYVYFEDAQELRLLSDLKCHLEKSFQQDGVATRETFAQLACYAAYRPLGTLVPSVPLAAFAETTDEPILSELFRTHILEPLEESALRLQIPSLGVTNDRTTAAVKQRYEDAPYPRWLNLEIPSRKSLPEFMRARILPTPCVSQSEGHLDILVAGCGTGRDAIYDAVKFRDASVTAIDVSLTSLGYAARKTAEYHVPNLRFFQADILALEGWERRFHLAESVGVLHHMEDPEAGLRILTRLLHPGGHLRLGFYSKLARTRFDVARRLLKEQAFCDLPEDLRHLRQQLLAAPEGSELAEVRRYSDFFMMSNLRDLLFHPHEREFSLGELAGMLSRCGLRFLGFEHVSEAAFEEFRRQFPDAEMPTDLELWDRFERQRPKMFDSMYVFWASRAD